MMRRSLNRREEEKGRKKKPEPEPPYMTFSLSLSPASFLWLLLLVGVFFSSYVLHDKEKYDSRQTIVLDDDLRQDADDGNDDSYQCIAEE